MNLVEPGENDLTFRQGELGGPEQTLSLFYAPPPTATPKPTNTPKPDRSASLREYVLASLQRGEAYSVAASDLFSHLGQIAQDTSLVADPDWRSDAGDKIDDYEMAAGELSTVNPVPSAAGSLQRTNESVARDATEYAGALRDWLDDPYDEQRLAVVSEGLEGQTDNLCDLMTANARVAQKVGLFTEQAEQAIATSCP